MAFRSGRGWIFSRPARGRFSIGGGVITLETNLEDLMNKPGVISWFIQHGVSPFSCYGTFPGTLGKLLEIKHVPNVDAFLRGLNAFLDA
jgi:hypothetical protein